MALPELLTDAHHRLQVGNDVGIKADLLHDIEYGVAFRDGCATENGEAAA